MKRLILNSFCNLKNEASTRKVFLHLKIFQKRAQVRRHQKETAVEVAHNQRIEKAYNKWRRLFKHFSKKRDLKEK